MNEMQLHTMQLTYTIDDHQRLRTMPAGEAPIHAMPSHEQKLYHPDDSDNDVR